MAKERSRTLHVSLKREMATGQAGFPSLQEETPVSSCDAASGLKSTLRRPHLELYFGQSAVGRTGGVYFPI